MTTAIAQKRLATVQTMLEKGTDVEKALAEVFGDSYGSALSFRSAIEPYLAYAATRKKPSTIKADRYSLGLLAKTPWAGTRLGEVRSSDIQRWAERRVTGGTSGATVNRNLNLASALYRWAIRVGYVEDNPLRRVERFSEKGRAREMWLTAEECRVLLDACPPFLRPLVLTATRTGMRLGELLALRWRAVDFNRREITVEAASEKTGRGRTVPFGSALHDALLELRRAPRTTSMDGSDAVLRSADGAPLTVARRRSAFESVVRLVKGIPEEKRRRLTFHVLRHTAASLMMQAGASPHEMMKIFGWSTLGMVARYAHLAPDAHRGAIRRLDEALDRPVEPTPPSGGGAAGRVGERASPYRASRETARVAAGLLLVRVVG